MNDNAEPTPSRKDLFLGLVHSFQAAAMQQMGKIMNPFTEKMERDLKQARLSIDMLEMLQERTSGNLTGEEARFLTHVLTELRLNYVAELDEDKKQAVHPSNEPAPGVSGPAEPGA
jgi:hypothetical protein